METESKYFGATKKAEGMMWDHETVRISQGRRVLQNKDNIACKTKIKICSPRYTDNEFDERTCKISRVLQRSLRNLTNQGSVVH